MRRAATYSEATTAYLDALAERRREIARRAALGETYTALGLAYGVNRSRIHQIVARERLGREYPRHPRRRVADASA